MSQSFSVACRLTLLALVMLQITHTVNCIQVREGVEAEPALDDVEALFGFFQRKYQRNYVSEEERSRRFRYFSESVERVRHLRSTNPHATFGLTEYSDLSQEEFLRRRTGVIPTKVTQRGGMTSQGAAAQDDARLTMTDVPSAVDWRTKGAVNPVRDQQQCGSCWAFASTAVIESQFFLKHGTLPQLSEQWLVSCDTGSSGCNGSYMDFGMDGLVRALNGQMGLRSAYPYASNLGYNPPCDKTFFAPGAVVKSSEPLSTNEDTLKKWVAQHGPIIVGVDATDLSHYHSGIITNGTSQQVDHAVVVVGYGSQDGVDYWIVRNSWSASWGEDGYFRVQRGVGMLLINSNARTVMVQ